jgi:hypothetical protein
MALAMTWAGTSCAIIPTGGTPASYSEIVEGDPLRKPYVRMVATPPRPEWSPENVVKGFLAAMASVDDPDWSVARQYLTDEAARTWHPQLGVTVYDYEEKSRFAKVTVPENATKTQVILKGVQIARIDEDGRYSATLKPEAETWPFALVKGPRGWRISDVLNGLMLTEADVRRGYRPVKLYYLDHQRKGLVVEEVRVPLDPSADFAESMVRWLLNGPTSKLKNVVSDAVPAGTTLRRVWTEDDKIIVDLNEAATNAISSSAGADAVEAMSAQIGWTLNQLTERWEVEIRVNGEPFYPDGRPLRVGFDRYGHFDPWLNASPTRAYFLKNGALQELNTDNEFQPVAGQAGQPGVEHEHPAVSGAARPRVAALTPGHDAVEVASLATGGRWERWITGKNLTAPSWDRYETVWAVDRLGKRSSRVLRHNGEQQLRVSAPGLETVNVRSLRVARDGVRVAVLAEDDSGVHVRVGTITVEGENTRIEGLRDFAEAAPGEDIVDIAWRDATTLLVLTGSKSGKEVLAISVTDGTTESFKADGLITSITALEDRILAGAEDPEENRRQLLQWDPVKSTWAPLIKESGTAPVLPLG